MTFSTNYFLPCVFQKKPWQGIVNVALWKLRIEVKCYLLLLIAFLLIGTKKIYYNILVAIVFIDVLFNLRYIGIVGTSEHSLLPFSFSLGMFMAINK